MFDYNRSNSPILLKNSFSWVPFLSLVVALSLAASVAWAAAGQGGANVDWLKMALGLFGGLALFLFGMDMMANSLKAVAGDRMRDVLGKLTTNRFMGVLTGTFVTAVIQSSSVTTVMLVGFVTAGLMSLSQAIGVIFGANIGTTVTAQIIAFKVTKFSLLFVAVGFAMTFLSSKKSVTHYGSLIMGLGLVFFGLAVMSGAMKPLRSYEPFILMMQDVANPFIGIGIAALFTALVQSSSATTGVVIAMATQGLISLEAGIAMILGANIGTCVTAGLAAIGKPREAVRVALAHVTFNVGGVVLMMGFIPYLADLVRILSPVHAELEGVSRLAAETPRQIANAHTVFNIFFSFLFLPFASLLARFCEQVLPDEPLTAEEMDETIIEPKYLDKELLSTPALALSRVRLEIGRLGDEVVSMHEEILEATLSSDRSRLLEVQAMDENVDHLHREIIRYLRQVGLGNLSDEQGRQFVGLMEIANNFENIGDIIETDLVTLGTRTIEEKIVISGATKEVISRFHEAVGKSLNMAVQATLEQDEEVAKAIIKMKAQINSLADAASLHGAQRLVANAPNRARAYSREMEMIEKYKRIYYFAKRVAKTVLSVPDDSVVISTEIGEEAT